MMTRLFENRRESLKPFLIYKNEAPAETQAPEKEEVKEKKESPASEAAAKGATPNEIWQTVIEPKYSMEVFEKKARDEADKAYRESINAAAAKAVPEGSFQMEKEDLVRRSVQGYEIVYKDTQRMFFAKGSELYNDRNKTIERVEGKTREELAKLRQEIGSAKEADQRAKEAVNVSKELKMWLDNQQPDILRYINKKEIKNKFEDYVTALNDFYLNEDWDRTRLAMPIVYNEVYRTAPEHKDFHIPIIKPDLTKKEDLSQAYKERSKFLKGRLEDTFEAKLDYLLSKKDTDLDTLKNFQKEIEDTYKRYASFDKRPGMIDLNDMAHMEYMASPSIDVISLLNTRGDKINTEMLEMARLMNPEAWDTAIELSVKQIGNDAQGAGLEEVFIKAASDLSGKKFDDFDDARKYLKDAGAAYAKIGVKETLDFIGGLNKTVNAQRLEIVQSVQPPSLAQMAYYERERLLSRRLVPQDESENLIVEFVSTTREGRERILKENGDALFKAIKNIETHYTKIYSDKYAKSIPKDPSKLVTRSYDREKPTMHDDAARLQALIMIAKEAELIAKNLGSAEGLKNIKVTERLENTSADKEPMKPGLRFTDTRKVRWEPYRSALYRGGFNGRDLGMNAIKVIGAITVVSNVLNCIREADKGTGWIDKISNSIEKIVSSPAVLAGAAVTAGAQIVTKNPEYYGYLRESPYGRQVIDSTRRLRTLSSRLGATPLKGLVHNENEWSAMDKLTTGQIKSLMKDAEKRNPKSPMITREDIAKVVPDREMLAGLPEGNTSSGVRYRFYQSFLTGNEKPNIGQLREICQKNKIVT